MDILDQDMAFAKQGDEGIFDGFLFADNGLADILLKGENHSAGIDHSENSFRASRRDQGFPIALDLRLQC